MTRALDPGPPAGLFADQLGRHGERTAIVTPGATITYAELDDRVRAAAEKLGSGRRLVLIGAANALEPHVAYLAALRGGHPVLLVADGDHATTRSMVATYDPDVVIAGDESWTIDERRASSAHDLHPDLALLLSTSGSTGSPKLVRLSRRNLQANAEAIAHYLDISDEDRAVTSLPMQYCYGLSVINSHLHRGAGLLLTDLSVVDRCFWDLVRGAGATSFAGVPHTFDLLDRVGFESMPLPSLRYVTQAGGRLHPDQVRRYAALGERDGWQLFVMYGQTEATARMAYLPPALASTHPHAIGVAIPGGLFTIEAPDDRGVGELVYRGPNVMLGYAESACDLALGATVDALRTGDLGRMVSDSVYELVGRRSRFLKLYGLRVDLDQVERMVGASGIACLCTGDDERLVVAVEAGTEPGGVGRLVADHLGVPRSRVHVVALAELPRTSNGKADYGAVLERAASAAAVAEARHAEEPGVSDHWRAVRLAAREILGAEPSDDDSFVSAGGDSLSYVEMSIRLEQILGNVPADWHTTPLRDLAPSPRRRFFAPTETSVVLRAVSIVLVVGTHAKLWYLPGGAHTLLGVAGYNFARFQLRATSMWPSIARVALPSMAWIGIAVATTDVGFTWRHALLLNGQLGAPDARWGYWYIEAIVQILALFAALFAIPAVRRIERRWPFASAITIVAAGLAVRFDLLGLSAADHTTQRPQQVVWIFALGWAAARATTTTRRLAVSALVTAAVPGFFGAPQRELLIIIGMLLIMWLPTVPIPRLAHRLVGIVASASLYIYLTQWQTYPPLLHAFGPGAAVTGSVLGGVAAWLAARWVIGTVEAALRTGKAVPAGWATRLAASRWNVYPGGRNRCRRFTPAAPRRSARP